MMSILMILTSSNGLSKRSVLTFSIICTTSAPLVTCSIQNSVLSTNPRLLEGVQIVQCAGYISSHLGGCESSPGPTQCACCRARA